MPKVALHAGPLVGIYYSSQFAPLIVFFLLFLAIVKNNKLHHFVRFNCMQARPPPACTHLVAAAGRPLHVHRVLWQGHSSAVLLLLSIGGEADAYLHCCFICTSYQQCRPP